MNALVKFWNNFKPQPDIWFFFGFLLTFTLSVRKVLFFYPIAGQFNEWAGIYLYLSDIFLFLTIFFWIVVILGNKNVYLSRINLERGTFFLAILPLFLVILAFLSAFWAENRFLAVFKSAKLLEFYLLYLYLIFRLLPLIRQSFTGMATSPQNETGGAEISQLSKIGYKSRTFLRGIILHRKVRDKQPVDILWIIVGLGLIQAIIGILQFILQRSVGLFWLFESHIAPGIDGVAKIVIGGEKYIRAYGLFPHPNILGGFLLISIILTWACYKIFHPSRLGGIGIILILTAQVIALILTFSKSAILGLIIGLGYVVWKNKKMFHLERNIPPASPAGGRGTSPGVGVEKPKFFLSLLRGGIKGRVLKTFFLIIFILILSIYLCGLNFGENLKKSYSDRLDQLEIWQSIIQNDLPLGVGAGNYVFHLVKMFRMEHLTRQAWNMHI
jgi:hypothetical protein